MSVRLLRRSVGAAARRASLAIAGAFGVGCVVATVGATDPQLARGQTAAPTGAGFFLADCARCHGRRGQGISDAPAILGWRTLPEYPHENPPSGVPGVQDPQIAEIQQDTLRTGVKIRRPFRTAEDLYTFVANHVHVRKFKTPGEKVAHDWAITTFLLATQGADLPPGGLTEENAAAVNVPHR